MKRRLYSLLRGAAKSLSLSLSLHNNLTLSQLHFSLFLSLVSHISRSRLIMGSANCIFILCVTHLPSSTTTSLGLAKLVYTTPVLCCDRRVRCRGEVISQIKNGYGFFFLKVKYRVKRQKSSWNKDVKSRTE